MQGTSEKSGKQKRKKKVAKKNGSLLELGRGRQMEQRGRKISSSRGGAHGQRYATDDEHCQWIIMRLIY